MPHVRFYPEELSYFNRVPDDDEQMVEIHAQLTDAELAWVKRTTTEYFKVQSFLEKATKTSILNLSIEADKRMARYVELRDQEPRSRQELDAIWKAQQLIIPQH